MKERAYKLLMLLQGILWFVFTIQSLLSGMASTPVLILMALDGAAYCLLAFSTMQRLLFKLAVPAFLVANTILTITDQMGVMDYLVLVWNLVLLVLAFLIIFQKQSN